MRALMSYESENRHMTEFPARVIIPFGFVIICLANVPVYLVNCRCGFLLIVGALMVIMIACLVVFIYKCFYLFQKEFVRYYIFFVGFAKCGEA